MTDTAGAVLDAWGSVGRPVRRLLRRSARTEFDETIRRLLRDWSAPHPPPGAMPPPAPPAALLPRFTAPVRTGADAAQLLGRAGIDDPAVLAVAVLHPCWYGTVGATPPRPLTDDGLGRVQAALLALGPVGSAPDEPYQDAHHRLLRYRAALPAVLRAVPLAVARVRPAPTNLGERDVVEPADVPLLAAGLPGPLRAALGVADAPAPPPLPLASTTPLGEPAEALALVSRRDVRSGRFELRVSSVGLIYRVGFAAPADEIYAAFPPPPEPGSPGPRYRREPGWLVDRITGALREQDLADDPRYWTTAGPVPLPPGWDHPDRPTPVAGLALAAGPFAPLPAVAAAIRALASDFGTERWPDRVLAWQRGLTAARLAASYGAGEVEVTAALLLAADPAGAVLMVPADAAARGGPAAELAATATTLVDGGAARAPIPADERTRAAALVAASDAVARAQTELQVFNGLPEARRRELYAAAGACPPLADLAFATADSAAGPGAFRG